MHRVLITGAAGRLGQVMRRGLAKPGRHLNLTDMTSVDGDIPAVVGDLSDMDFALSVVRDVDAVLHSAGIPDEAPFDELVAANVRATYNVFEAARVNDVPRVIFASSAHVVGFYPRDQVVDPSSPVRPDTVYGATKAFGEALGSLYADKHGLEVASLRIGSFRPSPENRRQLSTWLSERDAVQLVERCLTVPTLGHTIVYGVSANKHRWWSDAGWEQVGFVPVDDGQDYASQIPEELDEQGARWHGGVFAEQTYSGGAG